MLVYEPSTYRAIRREKAACGRRCGVPLEHGWATYVHFKSSRRRLGGVANVIREQSRNPWYTGNAEG